MTAQDAIFAVTQLIKVGGAIKEFREAKVLERDIKVALERVEAPPDFVQYFLALEPDVIDDLEEAKPYFKDGGFDRANCPQDVIDEIVAFSRERYFEQRRLLTSREDVAQILDLDGPALRQLSQWQDDNAPPSPLRRFGISMLGIALETAAANPKIFKTGANGQKLISAFLTNVAGLLPQGDNPDHFRVSFAERTASIMLTAGARALEENADAIWDQPRLREFGRALLGPITKRLNDAIEGDAGRKPYQLLRITNLRDELLAPMTHAALTVVAQNQQAFLGKRFGTDSKLGALTNTFISSALDETHGGKVLRVFSKPGFLLFYQRTLQLAAEKPQLFIRGRAGETEVARSVLVQVATVLSDERALPPFKGEVAAMVAAAAIEGVANGLPNLFTSDNPWDKVGVSVLQSIMSGFADGVKAGDKNAFERVLGREQAVEVVRLIAAQVALTPGMITSNEEDPQKANPEVRRIAQHVAELISAEDANLLSPALWTDVIAGLLRESAANPGALFSIDGTDAENKVAIHLVSQLFEVASAAWKQAGSKRTPSLRLFGETLADAAVNVARAAVRNAAKALTEEGQAAARKLAEDLNALAADEGVKLSDHDWRFLYKAWIAQVIETGTVPEQQALIDTLYIRQQQRAGGTNAQEEPGDEEPEGGGEDAGGGEA